MSPEKWEEIKENIKRQFSVEEQGTEDLLAETGEGAVKQGTAEFIIFQSPLGRAFLKRLQVFLQQQSFFFLRLF